MHSILEEHIHIYLERSHIILQRQRTHLLHAMPLQEDSIMSQTAPKSESKIRTNFIHVTALSSCKTAYSGYLIQENLQSASRKLQVCHRCDGGPEPVAINLSSDSILRNIYPSVKRTIFRYVDKGIYISMCEQMPQFLRKNRLQCGFK